MLSRRERNDERTQVLVSCDHYLPGVRAGGPIRSVAALAAALTCEAQFHVVTRDRDLGCSEAYADVPVGAWVDRAGTRVLYCPPGDPSLRRWCTLASELRPDVIYLNSLFSARYSIAPLVARRLGQMPRTRLVLAPRGELHPGALSIRRPKKVGFLRLARAVGLLEGVVWHATSKEEAESIREWFGAKVHVIVAPVIAGAVGEQPIRPSEKSAGSLEIAFLSRISPKKNLLGAIKLLDGLSGELNFNIFGPTEDRGYWEQCREAADELPPNVKVRYHGGVAAHEVADVLAKNHVLLFPTLGENFGHVISEALLAGVPVLVSDQTPWRGLEERRAGWDLPLACPDMFKDRIARLVDMDGREFAKWSHGARRCGIAYASDPKVVESNRRLFQRGPIL